MNSLVRWGFDQLKRNGRYKLIMDRDETDPYLERYYVLWPDSDNRERKDIPFNTFIHRFMRSDDDVFHNHPWDWYTTVVLKGGYWEHNPGRAPTWRGPGHVHHIRGQDLVPYPRSKRIVIKPGVNRISWPVSFIPADLHWVEIPKPGETYTLFTRGRTVNNGFWGFCPDLTTGEVIRHDIYLAQQKRKDNIQNEQVGCALPSAM